MDTDTMDQDLEQQPQERPAGRRRRVHKDDLTVEQRAHLEAKYGQADWLQRAGQLTAVTYDAPWLERRDDLCAPSEALLASAGLEDDQQVQFVAHLYRPIELAPAVAESLRASAALLASASPADALAAIQAGSVTLPDGEIPWSSDALMFTDTPTGDGRTFTGDGWGSRKVPLSLMAMLVESGWGHEGAFLAGRIETISHTAPNVPGTGFFADTDEGRLVALHIAMRNIRGVSVDLAIFDFVVEFIEDEDGWIIDSSFIATSYAVMGATVCPFPAFADAEMTLEIDTATPDDTTPAGQNTADAAAEPEVLAASAAPPAAVPLIGTFSPENPAPEWMGDQRLHTYVPWRVEDDGQVWGHLAAWGECHIGFGDLCVCAPRSECGYHYFLAGGQVRCADGQQVPTGTITLTGGHADELDASGAPLSWSAARAHYEDPARAGAYVTIGEDAHGIWVAGTQRAGLTAPQVQMLRAASLSGDWRRVPRTGRLELIGACCVNTPGFQRPLTAGAGEQMPDLHRPQVQVVDGQVVSLIAAAGTRRLANLKAAELTPPSRADFDRLLAKVDGMRSDLSSAQRTIRELEPLARQRIQERISL